jgi:hypothetical protein
MKCDRIWNDENPPVIDADLMPNSQVVDSEGLDDPVHWTSP